MESMAQPEWMQSSLCGCPHVRGSKVSIVHVEVPGAPSVSRQTIHYTNLKLDLLYRYVTKSSRVKGCLRWCDILFFFGSKSRYFHCTRM